MKFRFLLLLILPVLCLTGCKEERPGYDMVYTQFFTIDVASAPIQLHYVEFPNVPVNWATYLGDITQEEIGDILPNFIQITNNEGLLLDFIQDAYLEVQLNGSATFVEAGFRENVPFNTGTTLDLIAGTGNFEEEFKQPGYTIRIGLRYREFPPQTFQAVLTYGFRAYAK